MVITISQAEKGSKSFQIYDSWLEDLNFLELAMVGLIKLQQKLKEVKVLSKKLVAVKASSIKQIAQARTELDTSVMQKQDSCSVQLEANTMVKRKSLGANGEGES